MSHFFVLYWSFWRTSSTRNYPRDTIQIFRYILRTPHLPSVYPEDPRLIRLIFLLRHTVQGSRYFSVQNDITSQGHLLLPSLPTTLLVYSKTKIFRNLRSDSSNLDYPQKVFRRKLWFRKDLYWNQYRTPSSRPSSPHFSVSRSTRWKRMGIQVRILKEIFFPRSWFYLYVFGHGVSYFSGISINSDRLLIIVYF